MEVLLEVTSQRHEDEWHLAGGELHSRGEASLHHCYVGTCEMTVEAVDVRSVFDPFDGWHRARVDSGSGDNHEAQIIDCPASNRCQVANAPQEVGADARASDSDDADPFVSVVSEFGPQLASVAERYRIGASYIAGELIALLGPRPGRSSRSSWQIATSRQACPRPIGEEIISAFLRRACPARCLTGAGTTGVRL